jgi:hypothetical protein
LLMIPQQLAERKENKIKIKAKKFTIAYDQ